jgi:hypothetical protein
MAKVIERLDDAKIKKAIKGADKATSPAYLPDGKGLYLRVTPGGTATFLYRRFHKGNQHWMSLGVYPTLGLADARTKAQDQRNLRRAGADPLVERQFKADEEKAAQEAKKTADERAKVEAALTASRTKTFRACAEEYEGAHRLEWTNPRFETTGFVPWRSTRTRSSATYQSR